MTSLYAAQENSIQIINYPMQGGDARAYLKHSIHQIWLDKYQECQEYQVLTEKYHDLGMKYTNISNLEQLKRQIQNAKKELTLNT